jgi:Fic family protein
MSKSNYKQAVSIIKERVGDIKPELLEGIKNDKKIKNKIKEALKGSASDISNAKTIPEIASITQLPLKDINYHLAILRKYGSAEEVPERNKEFLKWKLKEK